MSDKIIPDPSPEQVKLYLDKWEELENYPPQEEALNKLFHECCPGNTKIEDILLKVAALNNFYSTNIFSTYEVAKHIQMLNIDERLKKKDLELVEDLKKIKIGEKEYKFYSFATKYCSHHKGCEEVFPIYDSNVDNVLWYFSDKFMKFYRYKLKDYVFFVDVLTKFQEYFKLKDFNFKQIDKYLWQLGKEQR